MKPPARCYINQLKSGCGGCYRDGGRGELRGGRGCCTTRRKHLLRVLFFGIQDKDEELHHSTLGSCITHEHNLEGENREFELGEH